MPDRPSTPPSEDVVLLHSPTDDGEGVRVVRARTGRPLEVGEVRAMKEGKPIMGAEVVKLKPREAAPQLCDVEVVRERVADAKEAAAGSHGPPQIATDAYRASWERIFGGESAPRGELN